MKIRFVSSIVVASALVLCCQAHAQFAGSVVDYTSGSLQNPDYFLGGSYNNPDAVLGQPHGIVGAATPYPGVYSPFDPPFDNQELTGIGAGGQLTLQLQNFVTVSPGQYEIGVWSDVGLNDAYYSGTAPDPGTATSPATTLSTPSSAVVSVSANGTTWVALNGGNPITFGMPGNYYENAGPYDSTAPASPILANFGQPFTETLSAFDGETYSQIISTLNGSAGGTWLDLDSTGLSEVGYIRFDVASDGQELDLSTVSINSSLAGEAIPEPGTDGLLVLGAIGLALILKRRQLKRCR